MTKIKPLQLTDNEINELLGIIEVCQSHLQDYDLENTSGDYDDEEDKTCPYKETNDDCNKWEIRLTKLQNK